MGSGVAGSLSISGGGTVTAAGLSLGAYSRLLAIDVGRGSSLALGSGAITISNAARVRLLAGAGVPAGNTYSPISAGTWSGSGTIRRSAGPGTRPPICSPFRKRLTGAAGTPVSIDQSQQQRILITDPASGQSRRRELLGDDQSHVASLTASPLAGTNLTALEACWARRFGL